MTNFKPDDDLAEWDAAYILGALSLEDRRTYEGYLAANPARAAELTEFAGMPGILNALSRDEAVALTDLAGAPPAENRPDNVASLAHAAAKRQQRSRRTWLAAAVASAAALLIAGARRGGDGLSAVLGADADGGDAGDAADPARWPDRPARRHREEVGHGAELGLPVHQGLVEERRQLRHRGDDARRRAEDGGLMEARRR